MGTFLRRKRFLVISFTLFIVAVLGATYVTTKDSDKVITDVVPTYAKPFNTVSSDYKPQVLKDFDTIIGTYNSGNYTEAAESSKNYAENSTNDTISRLNIYTICIRSAYELNNSTMALGCYEDSVTLASTLGDEDSGQWKIQLKNVYDKKETNTGGNDGPS